MARRGPDSGLELSALRSPRDAGHGSTPAAARFIGAVSNLAIQYNFSSLSIAVVLMTSHRDSMVTKSNGLVPDFPEPAWAENALLGSVFAGAAVGMVGIGLISDRIGRRRGMVLTQALVVGGAVAAALCTWGPPQSVYGVLAAARFVCGFGIGGIYPTSAAMSHEAVPLGEEDGGGPASEQGERTAAQMRVGWAFFWQTPGAMLPYLVALVLLAMRPEAWTTSVQFRVVLGIGALISAVPLSAAWRGRSGGMRLPPPLGAPSPLPTPVATIDSATPRTEADTVNSLNVAALVRGPGSASTRQPLLLGLDSEDVGVGTPALPEKVCDSEGQIHHAVTYTNDYDPGENHWLTLVGTGGTWFLYDVVYYSMNTFTPSILQGIFGASNSLLHVTLQSLVTSSMGIPGSLLAILFLRYAPARLLSILSFLALALVFSCLGAAFVVYPSGGQAAGFKFFLFCLSNVIGWWGGVSTYVIPAIAFPQKVRGTFHGLSAAAGKVGAVFGVFVYPVLQQHLGLAPIMWMQVAVSLLGALISVAFLRPHYPSGINPAPRGTFRAWAEYLSLVWH